MKEGSGASNENPLVVEEAVVVEHERKVVYHAHLFTGFTDFTEGSKSEIFGRCDAGASNENTTKPDTLKVKFEKYSGRDAGGIQSNSGELSSKEFIGFTDFEEGSKSEIFRRCDAGASNENEHRNWMIL